MTDWTTDKQGIHRHPWCGAVIPQSPGEFGKPTRWAWTDRRGIKRGSFATLAEAKLMARKLSGVEKR